MRLSVHARHARSFKALLVGLMLGTFAVSFFASAEPATTDPDARQTPRQLYNDGTRKLRDGKLREAESSFQSAVATQDERVQPVALYNLGHVRFREGEIELTNAPSSKALEMTSRRAFETGDTAIRSAREALASDDTQKIVSAYLRGRGARKELKTAMDAVKNALKQYAVVLTKWQRSSGDFKSAFELRPTDKDANKNGDVVDRKIAALIDEQQRLAEALAALAKQSNSLKNKELRDKLREKGEKQDAGSEGGMENPGAGDGDVPKPGEGSKDGQQPGGKSGMKKGEKGQGKSGMEKMLGDSLEGMQGERLAIGELMKELKKKLPKEMSEAMQQNQGEDEDEDEDSQDGDKQDGKKPKEPKANEREANAKEGTPSVLSYEEALRYLGLLKLDSDRKLSLGAENTDNVDPKTRRGRDW